MKKIISLVIVLALMLSMITVSFADAAQSNVAGFTAPRIQYKKERQMRS